VKSTPPVSHEASQTTSEWDIENLASRLHKVYQEELERQGKKSKYSDFYTELPEDIKDLDRALARYINSFIIPNRVNQTRAETAREIKGKLENKLLIKCECEDGDCNNCSKLLSILDELEDSNE